jgi:lathosterol oxidase
MQHVIAHILKMFPLIVLRYAFFAGIAYLFFYIWKRERYGNNKIQAKYPDRKNIKREIMYSVLSLAIFAGVGGVVYSLRMQGYTQIYTDFQAHSISYFIFSVVAFILIHDTYFYWMHRFMHWDKIYKYVHRIHHLSTNPTPWAAFAFHPLEAVVEVGILPIMVFLMPLHPIAILIWVLY